VLLERDGLVEEIEGKTSRSRKRVDRFRSNILKYVRFDDLSRTLYYDDINLFVIRNLDDKSNVIIVVIDLRNLKSIEQGTKG
jgi:hypothetical protein